MSGQIDLQVSQRIAILRFVMIAGIVILHTPQYVAIETLQPGAFHFFKALFQSAIFRCTVPVLTFISAYLLFGANLDQDPRKLYLKKAKSLAVPFLVFNLPLVAVAFLIQSNRPLGISYQLFPLDWHVMADAAFSLTSAPLNYPLYFMRDLMVLCVFAPLMGWFLRRAPLCGLLVVCAITLWHLDIQLILRRAMPLTFYLGGYAAVQKVDMRCLDKYAGVCAALFLAACILIVGMRIENTTPLRLLAPFLIWPAASLLVGTRAGARLAALSRYSLFIFLVHAPVLTVSWLIYSRYGQAVPYPLYWALTPVAVITLLIGAYRTCAVLAPRQLAWALGTKAATRRPAVAPASSLSLVPPAVLPIPDGADRLHSATVAESTGAPS